MKKNSTHRFLQSSFTVLFLLIFSVLQAQERSVKIRATNDKKEPLPSATITLIDQADSTQRNTMVADSTGTAVFLLTKDHLYTINISAVNYTAFEKGILYTGTQTNFTYSLEPAGKTLGGVVVTSKRPLIRQQDDMTIVDPEPIANSSTNGYEIIEKTPGLFVDQDGNIYINSLTPATVRINGREMKMSSSDIATLLKSLPPNSIDRIEILRTPSAKYDASGGGGMVNVVLKKGVKLGMTGSVNAGWQQGTYNNKFIGFNLNNSVGKRTSYLNLNYNNRQNWEQIKTDRIFAPDTMLSQDALTRYPTEVYYAGYGYSNQLTKKWDISYDGRTSYNKFDNRTNNLSNIRKISTNQLLTSNTNRTRNDGYSFYINNGIASNYKLDSLGSEWTVDIAHTYARGNADQSFITNFSNLPVTDGGDGNNITNRNFITAQTDLKWKMGNSFTFETGVKTSILNFKSTSDYFREVNGVRGKDEARTNTYKYNENINAAYLQGSKSIKDIIIKFGLRMENTNMKGRQMIPGDTSFTVHRTDFFPYVYLSKTLMKIAGFELRTYLVYRRTISRPVYEQLNPFPRFVDQYLTEVGNPSLRPQFTQNYEFNISVDETPLLAVGINDTKDIFTNVIYQADSSRSQAFRTYDNVGKNKEWYLRGLGAIPPGGTYFFVIGAQYNHNFFNGLYENQPLYWKKGTWTLFTYHQLKLGKRSQMTMNGFVRFKGQQQFYELTSFGALNASINRKFLKEKLTVTLSANDIFRTLKYNFTINQGSVDASGFRISDSRRFGINLRYNFGIRKREEGPNMFDVAPAQQ
jgi:hypothetical protein